MFGNRVTVVEERDLTLSKRVHGVFQNDVCLEQRPFSYGGARSGNVFTKSMAGQISSETEPYSLFGAGGSPLVCSCQGIVWVNQ